MENIMFQKTSEKMLLHQRANHADQKQTIENQYEGHDLSVWNKHQK